MLWIVAVDFRDGGRDVHGDVEHRAEAREEDAGEEELADVSVRAMTDLTPFLPPTTIKRSAKKARKPATAVMRS